MFSKEIYVKRRQELARRVGSGLILLLGNDEVGSNYEDNAFNFRQDSTFLYYFGLPYAGLAAVMDVDNGTETIFGNELTIDDIVWMGTQPTIHEKAAAVGCADVEPTSRLAEVLQKAQRQGRAVRHLSPYRAEHTLKYLQLLGQKPGEAVADIPLTRAIVDMRNHKQPEEIEEIERACRVTADMHLRAAEMNRPGRYEYEVAAALEEVAQANNCGLSFPTICTVNGQTLHIHAHDNKIKEGDMLLVDAGAETQMGYAGDMSSTTPASGKFTPRQQTIYDLQLAAHRAAVAMLRPGVPFVDVYEKSAEVICDGLRQLGIMKGDAREAVNAGAHAMFFPCGLGHMMGLDVHDMENLGEVWVGYDGKPKSTEFGRKSLRLARPLEPGFVLTIEPGVYFIPELIDLWRGQKKHTDFINYDELDRWRHFGGIRNEEDYLITPDGARLLGKKILPE